MLYTCAFHSILIINFYTFPALLLPRLLCAFPSTYTTYIRIKQLLTVRKCPFSAVTVPCRPANDTPMRSYCRAAASSLSVISVFELHGSQSLSPPLVLTPPPPLCKIAGYRGAVPYRPLTSSHCYVGRPSCLSSAQCLESKI